MWGFFTVCMLAICASIVLLVQRYADKNVEIVVKVMTGYGWLTAMMVIALAPLDTWAAFTLAGPSDTQPIFVLWSIAYWSTQAATWFILPFYASYADAGDFSVKNKTLTSLKENAIIYGAIGVAGAIGIVILLFTTGMNNQQGILELVYIGVFLSNAFGLVVGLLLMGYGLVEIPRSMWVTSLPETKLKWSAHRCGKFAEEVMRSTNELETVVTIIYANQKQMRRTDPLRPFMDIICDQAEGESPIKPSEMAQRNVDIESLKAEDLEYNYDKKGLSKLRRRLQWAIADYKGARAQYQQAMHDAFELEDVVKCRQMVDFNPPAIKAGPDGTSVRRERPWTRPLWRYKCTTKPYVDKAFAVLLGCLGCCIVWSEVVIPVYTRDLSPFSLMIRGLTGEFIFQLLVILPLIYMCLCSYFALFKITAFNYNKLIIGASTGCALMQNSSLLCRFAAPTVWNFYHIIRFAKDYCVDKSQCQLTEFSVIMGSMADVSTFKYFQINIYLPILLVFHCLMVAFGIWDKLLNMCRSSRFKFSTDDVDDEYTEKGRLLIRKELESTARGLQVGEILHSAYFDLEFPTVAGGTVRGTKAKGIFGGLFGKKKSPANEAPPPVVASSAPKPMSAAAAAAARWLPGGAGADGPAAGPAAISKMDNPNTSLLSARYEQGVATSGPSSTAPPAAAPPSAGFTTLDSLFADLGSRIGGSNKPAPTKDFF